MEPTVNQTIIEHKPEADKTETESQSNKWKTVCLKLKEGKCPHGVSGKRENDGQLLCSMLHPKRCRRFMRYASNTKFGCNKGNECEFYHPQHCKSSQQKRTCYVESCTLVHLAGTRRHHLTSNTGPSKRHYSENRTSGVESVSNRNPDTSNNNGSNENHFLEIRSLLESMQGRFQKEIQILKTDLANQKSVVEQLKLPMTPVMHHPPLLPMINQLPASLRASNLIHPQHQFFPQPSLQIQQSTTPIRQSQTNWTPTPQYSC